MGTHLDLQEFVGGVFERWVLPQDVEEDLLRSGLLAFEN